MTEQSNTAERDHAQDAIAIAGATMARDLVAAMLNEIRNMPALWSVMASDRQQQMIDALKDRAKKMVDICIANLARGTYPAVPATLEYVGNRKGIAASLTIAKDALCRHELFDAQGSQVLVVIAKPEQWFQRIDEIRAKSDQADLFEGDANYDPARDQPGYRRDQDPFQPAGPSWADLKKSLAKPADPDAAKSAEGEAATGDGVAGTSDDHADLVAQQCALQAQLAKMGQPCSLGRIQSWDREQLRAVIDWAAAYAADPAGCTIARPDCLPDNDNHTHGDQQ